MKVSIAYATDSAQIWSPMEVADGTTVAEVIDQSGLLERFFLDLKEHKVGIYGKLTQLDTPVKEGDRIEIYHPITRVLDDEDDDDED